MAKFEYVDLGSDQIGDEGMKTFSAALASGAMAKLETLYVFGNPGNAATVEEVCEARGISCM